MSCSSSRAGMITVSRTARRRVRGGRQRTRPPTHGCQELHGDHGRNQRGRETEDHDWIIQPGPPRFTGEPDFADGGYRRGSCPYQFACPRSALPEHEPHGEDKTRQDPQESEESAEAINPVRSGPPSSRRRPGTPKPPPPRCPRRRPWRPGARIAPSCSVVASPHQPTSGVP